MFLWVSHQFWMTGCARARTLTHKWNVDIARDRGYVHSHALRLDKQRRKGLSNGEWTVEVDLKKVPDHAQVLVQNRHEVIASCIVDEAVQSAARLLGHFFDSSLNVISLGDVKSQHRDVGQALEIRHLRGIAGCSENMESTLLQGERQGRSNATIAAASDEDALL